MTRMAKATVYVALPKGRLSLDSATKIEFSHNDLEAELAKDIVDALREKGYTCRLNTLTENMEVY